MVGLISKNDKSAYREEILCGDRHVHQIPWCTSSPILTMFYRGTIKSVLRNCIRAWFGNWTVSDRKTLQRIVRTAKKIIGVSFPSIMDIYTTRCIRKANSIVDDPTHTLFTLLPSGKRTIPLPVDQILETTTASPGVHDFPDLVDCVISVDLGQRREPEAAVSSGEPDLVTWMIERCITAAGIRLNLLTSDCPLQMDVR
ncbi:hypothetical protein QTP86_001482 [Hemibagrus guttatus]|nr:hypothetical protein QTP86_001482 [Hemibagrus guttatus]